MPRTIYGNESIDITVAGSGPSYTFSDPLAADVDNHVQIKTDTSLAVDPGTGVMKVADSVLTGKQNADATLTSLSGSTPTLSTPLTVQGTLTAGGTTGSLVKIRGKERWGATVDTANGINLALGINRAGNRQFVVSASDYDTATDSGLRFSMGSGTPYIGGVRLDGGAITPVAIGASYIDVAQTSVAVPTTATSAGCKLRLLAGDQSTYGDYATGVEPSHTWFQTAAAAATHGFKWYGNATQLARLDGTGKLALTNNATASTELVNAYQTSLPVGGDNYLLFGQSASVFNCANLRYHHTGAGNTGNYLGIGLYGKDNVITVAADGSTTFSGTLTLPNDVWHKSTDTVPRLFFGNASTTFYSAPNGIHTWRKGLTTDVMNLDANAMLTLTNQGTASGQGLLTLHQAGLPAGAQNYIFFGVDSGTRNRGFLQFNNVGTGSTANSIGIGFAGQTPTLQMEAAGALVMANNVYHKSADNVPRMYFQTNGGNMWRSGLDHVWCLNNNTTTAMGLDTNAMLTVSNTATATTTACRVLQSGLPAAGYTYMCVGRNNASSNEAAVLAFHSVGVGSASNTVELSLAGSANAVKIDAAGNVNVPGTLTAQAATLDAVVLATATDSSHYAYMRLATNNGTNGGGHYMTNTGEQHIYGGNGVLKIDQTSTTFNGNATVTGTLTVGGQPVTPVTKFSQSHCVTSNFTINVGSWNYWPMSALTQQFLAGTSAAESSVIAGKLSYVIPVNGIYLMTMSLMRNDSGQVSASGVAVFVNASTTTQTYWQLDAPQNYYTWSYQMYFNAGQRVAPVLYGNPSGTGSILASGQRGTPSAVNEFAITLLTPL